MAQPHTLDKNMHTTDLLVLKCRGCGFEHRATKRRAQHRYGPFATSYYIEMTSKCPRCGCRRIEAAIDRGGAMGRSLTDANSGA